MNYDGFRKIRIKYLKPSTRFLKSKHNTQNITETECCIADPLDLFQVKSFQPFHPLFVFLSICTSRLNDIRVSLYNVIQHLLCNPQNEKNEALVTSYKINFLSNKKDLYLKKPVIGQFKVINCCACPKMKMAIVFVKVAMYQNQQISSKTYLSTNLQINRTTLIIILLISMARLVFQKLSIEYQVSTICQLYAVNSFQTIIRIQTQLKNPSCRS